MQQLSFPGHRFFRGGHLQTLAGLYLPAPVVPYQAELILVDVPGGDKIALHDDCPTGWRSSDQAALLLHGLAGCHGSGYMSRIAHRLNQQGVRTFRMDMRGTGAATGLARLPGHAGRTEDAAAAIEVIANHCPESPLTMIGFSMGGNITLSVLADASNAPIGNLQRGIAVCPPVDLSKCCRELRQGTSRLYDRYLIHFLVQRWRATGGEIPGKKPTSIYQFDDEITAPLSGFSDAEDYYAHASSGPRLKEITLPTRILAAEDDPVVAFAASKAAVLSPSVELFHTKTGGHLGYVTHRGVVPGGRWMDWLVTEWVLGGW